MGNHEHFCNCRNKTNATTEQDLSKGTGMPNAAFITLSGLINSNNNNIINSSNNNNNSNSNHNAVMLFNKRKQVNLNSVIQKNAVNKIIKQYRLYRITKHLNNNNNNNCTYNNNNIHNVNTDSISINSKKSNGNLHNIATNTNFSFMQSRLFHSSSFSYIGNGNNNNNNNSNREEFGIKKWKDGSKFLGYFHSSSKYIEGYGIFTSKKETYQGEFHLNRACGYGMYYQGTTSYEGYWKNDLQQPIGIEIWKDTSQYQGEYVNGTKSGVGIYTWPDTSKYEGEWKCNSLHGIGIYYFTGNRLYIGNWEKDMKHGFGEFIWKDDKRYLGYYHKDKKHGFGLYYWQSKCKIFIGFWKNGKQCGYGKYISQMKTKYGFWKENGDVLWFKEEKVFKEKFQTIKEVCAYAKIFDYSYKDLQSFFINNDLYNCLLYS
jgi:hypothetical protein